MEISSAVDSLSALAHESRLAIFRLLVPGRAAGEIGNRLGIAANALSFHLTRLRFAGLVSVRRNGQQMGSDGLVVSLSFGALFLVVALRLRDPFAMVRMSAAFIGLAAGPPPMYQLAARAYPVTG